MTKPIPRPEFPRPDRERKDWLCLNGEWGFAFDEKNTGEKDGYMNRTRFSKKITVPYCYQSELSGVNDLRHSDYIWYHKAFKIPASFGDKRVLLRFGAVDYIAKVWINGVYLGSHEGGYTPFEFDITSFKGDTCNLTVRCEDRLETEQPRGKQSHRPEPFACWYSPVSGIWQSVWLEAVGQNYIEDFRITPDFDNGTVGLEVRTNEAPAGGVIKADITLKGVFVASAEFVHAQRSSSIVISLNRGIGIVEPFTPWSPGNPALYDIKLTYTTKASVDTVYSYFGMRKITIKGDRIFLNNREIYQRLILDQGYWKESLLTPPTDEAIRRDIELTKKLGYNGARKHQKFEDPRYYYWADKMGLLVWEELPSAYYFTLKQKTNMFRDMTEAIQRDYNHPSIIAYVPVNESWGVYSVKTNKEMQTFCDALYYLIHSLDDTRFVSNNDGWEQPMTDIVTAHDYSAYESDLRSEDYKDPAVFNFGVPNKAKAVTADGYNNLGKPCLLTEYGGIAFTKDSGNGNWGYNGAVTDEKVFIERFDSITTAFKNTPFLCGYCYTQLTDVFQEVNGLLDMDRNPKVSIDEIRRINLKRK